MPTKSTRAPVAQSRSRNRTATPTSSHASSIADLLERSPGGVAGAPAQALRRARQGNLTLADIGRTAQALELPVWVLLIPGVAGAGPEIGRHQAAIQKMVEDYVAEHCIAPALRGIHEGIGEETLRGR